jgi:hypothetical protein
LDFTKNDRLYLQEAEECEFLSYFSAGCIKEKDKKEEDNTILKQIRSLFLFIGVIGGGGRGGLSTLHK